MCDKGLQEMKIERSGMIKSSVFIVPKVAKQSTINPINHTRGGSCSLRTRWTDSRVRKPNMFMIKVGMFDIER